MLVTSTSKSFKLAEILLCISLAIYGTVAIDNYMHVIFTVYCIVEKSMKSTYIENIAKSETLGNPRTTVFSSQSLDSGNRRKMPQE